MAMETKKPGNFPSKKIPSVHSRALKDLVIEAFHKAGGVDYLVGLSETDPKTFMTVVAKVIPLQVDTHHTGSVDNNINIKFITESPAPELIQREEDVIVERLN